MDEEHVAAEADRVEYADDFVCICSDDKRAVADELREEARRILEAGTDEWCPGSVVDRDYLDAAVGWLHHHHCHIAEILTDQWSLVEVVEQRLNSDTDDFDTTLVLRIQCDRVEDGIARGVQLIADRLGPTGERQASNDFRSFGAGEGDPDLGVNTEKYLREGLDRRL